MATGRRAQHNQNQSKEQHKGGKEAGVGKMMVEVVVWLHRVEEHGTRLKAKLKAEASSKAQKEAQLTFLCFALLGPVGWLVACEREREWRCVLCVVKAGSVLCVMHGCFSLCSLRHQLSCFHQAARAPQGVLSTTPR